MIVNEMCRNENGAPPPAGPRLFGIEVEYERAILGDNPTLYPGWSQDWGVTSDGSLRNSGVEFVSTPMTMHRAAGAFRKLTAVAQSCGWEANARTGIHVHADMRDLHLEQVAGVVAAYAAFEPIFFALAGAERENCIYCVPWYRAPDQANMMAQIVSNYSTVSWNRHGGLVKYSALYLQPLRRLGTIEFRHAPTWLDPAAFRRWIAAINRVVEWGMVHTPASVLDRCSSDITPLVEDVFGWTAANVQDPEALIDEADSLGTVAEMLPNTYEASDWLVDVGEGLTEGIGYHAPTRRPHFVVMDEATHYDDEDIDEDYDDEEDY